jgi:hypothetical protein
MAAKKPQRAKLAGRNAPLSPRRLNVADKRRKALELRKAGASFESIAQELGFANKGGAYKAVRAALDHTAREPVNQVRKLELERLDRLFLSVWPPALKGDGKSLDRCLQIIRQRSSLEGLNVDKVALTDPTGEKEFSGGLTDEERTGRLMALLEQVRTRRDGQAAVGGASAPVDTAARSPDAGLPHASG